ncbi:tRNA glutamyl-Q(34) synthetase GluQRS [Brevundimonas sp. KM4]|uniref:tRNA glutamyl-Q(34) synthetase GluQRS n=1 Tax=Brevundimonas sp. KM4 TaxID=1628191 RepID=UPI0005F78134|nr:tRNA glutamyl-Q(34) synthetase GluQRS [Brevundimonas sp. KM4]KJV41870.1 glutamyl-tRNA synthetase [Brevundimonas sp. KM4]
MMFATRFAPSPTGCLHKGHAFSALTAWTAAKTAGGRFVLRIEDIDPTRCRLEHEAGILEDLAWLGLDWDTPVRRQSDHLDDYAAVIEGLRARGLLYRCFRTRKELLSAIGEAPHGAMEAAKPGPHTADEETHLLASGAAFAWRLSLDRAREALGEAAWNGLSFVEEGQGPNGETGVIAVDPEAAGDVVLARKDTGVAYHLAVTHDDALQGITNVIRGQDLFEATHVQRLIQTLMGWPAPTYRHHVLLAGPDGRRYAKRDRSITLAELRAGGLTAEALRADLGFNSAG